MAPKAQPGRSDPCHCGSGRKYKRCCLEADREAPRRRRTVRGRSNPVASSCKAPPGRIDSTASHLQRGGQLRKRGLRSGCAATAAGSKRTQSAASGVAVLIGALNPARANVVASIRSRAKVRALSGVCVSECFPWHSAVRSALDHGRTSAEHTPGHRRARAGGGVPGPEADAARDAE
jgi:SEC-C motif